MKLPEVVASLVKAQNNFDSVAYSNCFSSTAVVHDEGKVHQGRVAIKNWIEAANKKYQASLTPQDFKKSGTESIMTANVSGTFPGSPVIMKFHLEFEDRLIQSLKITA